MGLTLKNKFTSSVQQSISSSSLPSLFERSEALCYDESPDYYVCFTLPCDVLVGILLNLPFFSAQNFLIHKKQRERDHSIVQYCDHYEQFVQRTLGPIVKKLPKKLFGLLLHEASQLFSTWEYNRRPALDYCYTVGGTMC